MSESRRYATIPSLDGLRAVSIGLVFAGHVGFELIPGGFGVTVFFVLSGYLITTLLRMEHDRSGGVSLRNFYRRRIFRIWPAFYAVLLFGTVLTLTMGLGSGSVDGLPLLGQVMHVFNYFEVLYDGSQEAMWGTGIFWSLAIEEHFYLILPLLFVIMNQLHLPYRRQAMVLCALAAAVLVWRCVLVYGFHVSQARTYYSTDTRADALLLGCALALNRNPVIDEVRESPRAIRTAAIVGVLTILATFLYRDFEFREGFRYTIQAGALVLIIRYVILAPRSPAGRVLNARWIVPDRGVRGPQAHRGQGPSGGHFARPVSRRRVCATAGRDGSGHSAAAGARRSPVGQRAGGGGDHEVSDSRGERQFVRRTRHCVA
jgi:peptidoglycan/LPS O-acetylase OafA/YrhL